MADQCVFIRGFRAKRILLGNRRIRAAAEEDTRKIVNLAEQEMFAPQNMTRITDERVRQEKTTFQFPKKVKPTRPGDRQTDDTRLT